MLPLAFFVYCTFKKAEQYDIHMQFIKEKENILTKLAKLKKTESLKDGIQPTFNTSLCFCLENIVKGPVSSTTLLICNPNMTCQYLTTSAGNHSPQARIPLLRNYSDKQKRVLKNDEKSVKLVECCLHNKKKNIEKTANYLLALIIEPLYKSNVKRRVLKLVERSLCTKRNVGGFLTRYSKMCALY